MTYDETTIDWFTGYLTMKATVAVIPSIEKRTINLLPKIWSNYIDEIVLRIVPVYIALVT